MNPKEQAAFDALKNENAYLKYQIEILNEQLQGNIHKLYGTSSEQSVENGQTTLFGQDKGVFKHPESTGNQIKTPRLRQAKRKSSQTKITKSLPVKEVTIHLENDTCDRCGEKYQIFKAQAGEKLHYQPAQLYIVKTYKELGKCGHCSKDVTFDGDKLITAKPPVPLISRSLASASLVANIVANKFELALPLDRQRHALSELGLVVSETTICNWVTAGAKWVTNLSDHLLTM